MHLVATVFRIVKLHYCVICFILVVMFVCLHTAMYVAALGTSYSFQDTW